MNDTAAEDDGLVVAPAPGGPRRIDDPWRECGGNCASITRVHSSIDVDGHDTRCVNRERLRLLALPDGHGGGSVRTARPLQAR